MTIEEKIEIDFGEYLSCFDDDGDIKEGCAENAECCIKAINKAVNKFIDGAETIAHHGFNVYGNKFHAEVVVSVDEDCVSLKIMRDNHSGELAEYVFGTTTNLVMTKSFNLVSIV
jgi:hypothetical protein